MKIERAAEWRRICFHRISGLTSLFSLLMCVCVCVCVRACVGRGGVHENGQDSEEHAASFPLHILIPPTFS